MRSLTKAFAPAAVLLCGLAANAQYQPRYDRDRDYYRNNYNNNEDQRYNARAAFLDRLQADLDRASSTAIPFTGDSARIARARANVNELQRDLNNSGYVSRRDLNMAINSIQMVLNRNHLMSQDERDMLATDVSRMQNYESRMGSYSYNPYRR